MALALLKKPQPRLTFLCRKEGDGVIPALCVPRLPDWFGKLPAIDETQVSPTKSGITVKRCMPFLDATATWLGGPGVASNPPFRPHADRRRSESAWCKCRNSG